MPKRRFGIIYKTDGTEEKVYPAKKQTFDYKEIQGFVGGYIESVILKNKRHRGYVNEEGALPHVNLQPNPWTQAVLDMPVYRMNGYAVNWQVRGNIFVEGWEVV